MLENAVCDLNVEGRFGKSHVMQFSRGAKQLIMSNCEDAMVHILVSNVGIDERCYSLRSIRLSHARDWDE